MSGRLKTMLALLRPEQWIKSAFVLPGLVYAGVPAGFGVRALIACGAFALVSSAVYIVNDVRDRDDDRLHPRKKDRPLASGRLSLHAAIGVAILLLVSGLTAGALVSTTLLWLLLTYLGLCALYNCGLREVPILDVVCIAYGFLLRVLAGTIGIGLPVSRWLLITATLLSLCIALSKRLLEKKLYTHAGARSVLVRYTEKSLGRAVCVIGLMTFLTFAAYTLQVHKGAWFFYLPLLPAAFGLYRFVHCLHQTPQTDDPLMVFARDPISCINAVFFILLTLVAVLT